MIKEAVHFRCLCGTIKSVEKNIFGWIEGINDGGLSK